VRQGKELNAKVAQLSHPGVPGSCPLCGTELGPHGHQRVIAEYQSEVIRQRQRYRDNDRRLNDLRAELDGLAKAALAGEQEASQAQTAAAGRLRVAEEALIRARAAWEALPAARAELAALQERLASEAGAGGAAQAVATAEAAITALGYDPAVHRAVQDELRRLAGAPEAARALEETRRQHPLDMADHDDTIAALGRRASRRDEAAADLATLDRELAATPDVTTDLAEATAQLTELTTRLRGADQALGMVRGEVAASEEAEAEARRRRTQAASAEFEKQVYDDLALAFGRRGLQAMLIDAAIPELEEEANRLLARLTDNSLNLRLATQRQARGGITMGPSISSWPMKPATTGRTSSTAAARPFASTSRCGSPFRSCSPGAAAPRFRR